MRADVRWWAESEPASGYSSGLAARLRAAEQAGDLAPPPLRVGLPKRVLVPVPRVATARVIVTEPGAAGAPARRLDVDWPVATAQRLDERLVPAVSDVQGSIDLTGQPWQEIPAPPLDGLDRAGSALDGSDAATREIPLWKRLAYLLQPPPQLLLARHGPVEWPDALFPYQMHGVQALLERETLLLADDMGLGKSVQVAAALRVLALRGQVETALLVAPANLLGQWRQTLRAWAPELRVSTVRGPAGERAWQWGAPAHVYLIGYETFREDCTDNPYSPPRRRQWDAVILDEAQRIKNRGSEVSRKVKLLRRRRAWALTGTPIENSLDDLASILEFVTPHRDGGPRRPAASRGALLEQLRTLQLRRRKADVLAQLPPKTVTTITLPLAAAQRESYERAEREGIVQLRESGENLRVENVLDLVVKLKQICNFCPATGQSAKLDDLQQRLATLRLEGHRALIFTQFVKGRFGAHALAARLQAFRPLLYTGDMLVEQREATVQRFKEDESHAALILSLRSGGYGLNLQEASYVFHFDRWWNPAVERQAEDRSHRLGQTHPVHVYAYLCEGTIEERIDEVLRQKQALFADLVDETTLDVHELLTSSELLGLFGLRN